MGTRCSRLVLLALGSLVSVGVTSCSRPEVVVEISSPDVQQTYTCGQDPNVGALGCHTHWCWHFTQQNLEDLKKMNVVSLQPCYAPSTEQNKISTNQFSSVNAGGVPWWWNKGNVGDPILKGFDVQDYRRVNGSNDTIYGDAVRQKGSKYCYDVKWSGKYWGTYCMVPMNEAASF